MPRNVRNFWFVASVDGRSGIASGPVSKDGGMSITIYQRHNGEILEALRINCLATHDGVLTIAAYDPSEPSGQRAVIKSITKR